MKRGAIFIPALLALAAANTVDFPPHKAGLWQVTSQSKTQGAASYDTKVCLDASSNAAYNKYNLTGNAEKCSKSDMRRSGAQTIVDTVCENGGSTVTSHSVITWSGNTAYHIDSTAHWAPAMMGQTDTASSQDAKWVSECPADMAPGDMIMPDGMKMNLGAIEMGAGR